MNYLFILLISILYTILFYGKVKGLSMLLFTLIFLVFTKYYLKKQDLIKNRKAFLYMIPIILLSLTLLSILSTIGVVGIEISITDNILEIIKLIL